MQPPPPPDAPPPDQPARPKGLGGHILALSRTPYGYLALFGGALLEATIFPWPVEIVLAAMMLDNRRRIWLVTAIAISASVLGGVLFYFVGAYLFETLGQWLVGTLDMKEQFETKRQQFQTAGFWIIFIAAQTPIPFQITTMAAGVAGVAFGPFFAAALLGRTVRYLLMAVPTYFFGPAMRRWWLGLPNWVRTALYLLVAIVFVLSIVYPFLH